MKSFQQITPTAGSSFSMRIFKTSISRPEFSSYINDSLSESVEGAFFRVVLDGRNPNKGGIRFPSNHTNCKPRIEDNPCDNHIQHHRDAF